MDFMRYVFHLCTMNTSYRVNFPIVSKSMCIHLLSDSNTKCTHLGGVHPMVCDFETNMFLKLIFCSLIVSHDLLNKTSISKFIGHVLMHVLTLVYQVILHLKDFQLVFNFNWYHDKSPSNWYIQDNKDLQRWFDFKGEEFWIKARCKWISSQGGATLIQKGKKRREWGETKWG